MVTSISFNTLEEVRLFSDRLGKNDPELIKLSCCFEDGPREEGVTLFATALQVNHTLTILHLSQIGGDQGAEALWQRLSNLTKS